MKFENFLDAIKGLETIASEFMSDVAIQVTRDIDDNHSAIFMTRAPYSEKTRDLRVTVSPFAPDELIIELNKDEESFLSADVEGFYKFLWLAAESDFAKTNAALKQLMSPYSIPEEN